MKCCTHFKPNEHRIIALLHSPLLPFAMLPIPDTYMSENSALSSSRIVLVHTATMGTVAALSVKFLDRARGPYPGVRWKLQEAYRVAVQCKVERVPAVMRKHLKD